MCFILEQKMFQFMSCSTFFATTWYNNVTVYILLYFNTKKAETELSFTANGTPKKNSNKKKRDLTVYCFSSYPVLRPPASVQTRTALVTRSCRSRRAVSVEHLFIFAHLEDVNFPPKPSHSILTIRVCRSFITVCQCASQNEALCNVRTTVSIEAEMASFSLSRNHNSHSLMSSAPFYVLSNTS